MARNLSLRWSRWPRQLALFLFSVGMYLVVLSCYCLLVTKIGNITLFCPSSDTPRSHKRNPLPRRQMLDVSLINLYTTEDWYRRGRKKTQTEVGTRQWESGPNRRNNTPGIKPGSAISLVEIFVLHPFSFFFVDLTIEPTKVLATTAWRRSFWISISILQWHFQLSFRCFYCPISAISSWNGVVVGLAVYVLHL